MARGLISRTFAKGVSPGEAPFRCFRVRCYPPETRPVYNRIHKS